MHSGKNNEGFYVPLNAFFFEVVEEIYLTFIYLFIY